ncbi:MAG: hypothetical protein WAO20_05055 [Acidobacteriota bacterium]
MKLAVTWDRTIIVWWALFWRQLIAGVVGLVVSAAVGTLLGLVFGAMKIHQLVASCTAFPLGLGIGLGLSIIPVKMVLGKEFGEFQLVLLKRDAARAMRQESDPPIQHQDV